ncbi:hypothetical protein VitviT2T_018839 [Vitis vinifera]|uniref:Uncharacterized protein n=1 Tax=Vitis vinifera TaxID=29760 RepID=A0ABY9CZC2_VITVI|nr:hypothetical protein VitviT2T_018839 [Vitis vinifera]
MLGWDVELAVERRPIVEGLIGSKEVCGPSLLSPISFRLETNLQRRPIEEGHLGSMEDSGLSQLGALPNTHLKSCVEVGTLESHKGPIVGRSTVKDSFEAEACGGFREEICGCLDGADFGLQQVPSPPTPKTKML